MENDAVTHTPKQNDPITFSHHCFQSILRNYGWQLGFVAFTLIIVYRLYRSKKDQLNLPTAGIQPGLLGPWKAGIEFFNRSEEFLHEGYNKYSPTGTPFIVSTLPRYVVVLTDPEHIEELRTAPESELSFNQALEARIRISLTIDPSIVDGVNNYHLDVIRHSITQRLTTVLPEVVDEVDCAWKETAKVGDDWTRVNVWTTLSRVTTRASNRLFVGLPLCRNKEFIDIMLTFAMKVAIAGFAADHLPFFLRRPIVWLLLKRYRYQERTEQMLGPIFDERRRKRKELGDEKWDAEKPKDIIQWVLDAASSGPKEMQTNTQLTLRLLTLNFVAIHTSSLSITHILYDLAANPEYMEPLREEIISVLDTHGGYTKLKQSLTMMKKLDSVLKESQRCNGTSSIVMNRMVLCDYTFKSGRQPLTLPKGTMLTVPATAVHKSPAIYGEDASEWKGFRFSDIRESKLDAASKHQMVSTNSGYVTFGHGVHACPGRFVATNQLKILLSYLLLRYDIRLPEEWKGKRPPNQFNFGSVRANTKADLEFRPRKQWKELENRWPMPWDMNLGEI